MKRLLLTAPVVAGSLLCGTTTATQAHLIYAGVVDMKGTGLGAVPTILTMTSANNGTEESGKVSWNGSKETS